MPFRIQKAPPTLTQGIYPAQVKDVKIEPGAYGERIRWTFELLHQGYTYQAMGWTNPTFYPGSPEHRWASLILGQDLQPDEAFEEAELIGAPVLARISAKPGRNGPMYSVDDLLPPKGGETSEVGTGTLPDGKDESDVPF